MVYMKSMLRRLSILTSLFIIMGTPFVRSQNATLAPGKIDVSTLGPQVGQRVPDFSLKDQNGRTFTLNSIMGAKGAMLVFFRSANW
jgi:cytochrome oxidase Cu insertion factor (SCO1/SenC/PrrC family)